MGRWGVLDQMERARAQEREEIAAWLRRYADCLVKDQRIPLEAAAAAILSLQHKR